MLERQTIADLWWQCSQISRRDIFGADDPLRPVYPARTPLEWQVDIPAVGMVGPLYDVGGTALLSVNPAGGSEGATTNPTSDTMYEAFRSLRDSKGKNTLHAFEAVNRAMTASMPKWRISAQYLASILGALNREFDETAYLFLVPFRTRGDSGSRMQDEYHLNGYKKHLRQQLNTLLPGLVVCMDRPTDRFAQHWSKSEYGISCEVFYFTRQRDAHAARRLLLEQLRTRFAKP